MENNLEKKRAYITMISYMAIYFLFVIFSDKNSEHYNTINTIFESVALTIVLLKVAHLNLKSNKQSLILASVFISLTFGFVRRLAITYYLLVLDIELHSNLFIGISSLIVSLVILVAFINEIRKYKASRATVVLTIDIIIIILASIPLTWDLFVAPNLANINNLGLTRVILEISYPAVHLGMLISTYILYKSMNKQDPTRKSIFVYGISFTFMYLANLSFAYFNIKNMGDFSVFVNSMWMMFYFTLMIASIKYTATKPLYIVDKNLKANSLMPALSIIIVFVILNFKREPIIWMCFGVLIIVVGIRQMIIDIEKKSLTLQLRQLNAKLEEKVEKRTQEKYEVECYDHLTGLYNRRLFEETINSLIENNKYKEFCVMLLDLDRFKIVNDTYGHQFGDLLIQKIAEILKESACENTIISRQGGDEFAVLVKGAENEKNAKSLSVEILNKLKKPIKIREHVVYITFSIGIARYPEHGKNYQEIIGSADLAMYHSKYKGRATYSFYQEYMYKLNSKRMTFERELHNAIEEEQFILHYQPQVDASKNEVIGVEALIRWDHPEQGIISPFEFIGIAEETGLIGPIGDWVLKTACAQTKIWHDQGYKDLKIGINISAYQFEKDDFVDLIKDTLRQTNLEAKYLDLEITESIAMKNEVAVITKLKKLKDIGVQVSMDDFGTGYSSLSYLNRFPIDTLKIPREFIMEIKPYDDKRNIIQAIISIANNLGLGIIAEGVEEEVQLEYLKQRNCNNIQGYLFSRPLPTSEVEAFLNTKINMSQQTKTI